jgi:hypothetical protein
LWTDRRCRVSVQPEAQGSAVAGGIREHQKDDSGLRAALEEMFRLLEDYAPAWYTEEHHDRIVSALRSKE